MSQSDLRTHEIADDSSEHPAQPRPPARPRVRASSAIAALLVAALAIGTFAVFATHRGAPGAPGAKATHTPAPRSSPAASGPGRSQSQPPAHGVGLPKGVEILTFAMTGPDEAWATAAVITDGVIGFPARGMIYHYSAGTWIQIGPALPDVFLGGLDMISSSEGWAYGGDANNKPVFVHISNGDWQRATPPPIAPGAAIDALAMRAPGEGWLAVANLKTAYSGANTTLFHLSDGVWSQIHGAPYYITDIAAVADNEAWVIGWTHIGASVLYHVQNGAGTLALTGPHNSSFTRLRMFAPNDIWLEGAQHAKYNVPVNDLPLDYHFDGASWTKVGLQAPGHSQHAVIASPDIAWSWFSAVPTVASNNAAAPSTDGYISSIYSNAGGQWRAIGLPYRDLGTMAVLSNSDTDIWAIGVYMVFTAIPDEGQSYSGVSHYVLLRYTNGSWTEWGRS